MEDMVHLASFVFVAASGCKFVEFILRNYYYVLLHSQFKHFWHHVINQIVGVYFEI